MKGIFSHCDHLNSINRNGVYDYKKWLFVALYYIETQIRIQL